MDEPVEIPMSFHSPMRVQSFVYFGQTNRNSLMFSVAFLLVIDEVTYLLAILVLPLDLTYSNSLRIFVFLPNLQ